MARTPLDHQNASIRLRAALDAGTAPGTVPAAALVARSAVEPDFFVRDMLTWALTRLPAAESVPLLRAELGSPVPQARSQALHSLSKIGGAEAAAAFGEILALTGDADDEVAKAAWRASGSLAPDAAARRSAARAFVAQLGRGDAETRRSLSRAILALGDEGASALVGAPATDAAREHVAETERLLEDPDSGWASAVHEARRVAALGRAN
ncbi:HEAT repeat domain-containing protein [Tsukamurella asaccharolytica]|uniref:HEAT repeat domain-containing protein n=1 Tax=Tsukamurella asaccharolytica TaxID=2592067 RepID=A0A5C5R8S3_9ACTN|nr:HEAT repeat domain-containing protein [Tsukamurella asaccharolytica]TWS18455.1 HEAT repeat domain-containing protein [Tsukamurella asaccharolytica]